MFEIKPRPITEALAGVKSAAAGAGRHGEKSAPIGHSQENRLKYSRVNKQ